MLLVNRVARAGANCDARMERTTGGVVLQASEGEGACAGWRGGSCCQLEGCVQ